MVDEFRRVARWSSNYNFIGAQMNGRIKHTIYEWITLESNQTHESQIYKNNSKVW